MRELVAAGSAPSGSGEDLADADLAEADLAEADWSAEDTPDPQPGEPYRSESRFDRLAARLPVRLDPGRRGALAVGAAVLLAAVVTGLWLSSSRPAAAPVATAPSVAGATPLAPGTTAIASGVPVAEAPAATPSASPAGVVVDVAGKVRHPGVYTLPPGSRVDDAIERAGGARRGVDLTPLNLAALLVDGQQIAVGRPGAAAAPVPAGAPALGAAATSAVGAPVDLNTATLEQLESLPGIGPALGQRILDYRTAHGSFRSVSQLDDVSGIGPATLADLQPLVTV